MLLASSVPRLPPLRGERNVARCYSAKQQLVTETASPGEGWRTKESGRIRVTCSQGPVAGAALGTIPARTSLALPEASCQ